MSIGRLLGRGWPPLLFGAALVLLWEAAALIRSMRSVNASQIRLGAGKKYGFQSNALTAISHRITSAAPNRSGGHTRPRSRPMLTAPPQRRQPEWPARRP